MLKTAHKTEWGVVIGRATGILVLLAGILFAAGLCTASPRSDNPVPNIFDPRSTPAEAIRDHSYFVLAITGLIFLVVVTLLVYAVVKFRDKPQTAGREPAQVYGSTQIELAWTIIPVLIVLHYLKNAVAGVDNEIEHGLRSFLQRDGFVAAGHGCALSSTWLLFGFVVKRGSRDRTVRAGSQVQVRN